MTEDEWKKQLTKWCGEDETLLRLPYIFFAPIAKKLAQRDAAQRALIPPLSGGYKAARGALKGRLQIDPANSAGK